LATIREIRVKNFSLLVVHDSEKAKARSGWNIPLLTELEIILNGRLYKYAAPTALHFLQKPFCQQTKLSASAGTVQFVWERVASRPLFSAFRRKPPVAGPRPRLVRCGLTTNQPARRRLVRPGRSRSPFQLHRFG
jgi:hypothetical protein